MSSPPLNTADIPLKGFPAVSTPGPQEKELLERESSRDGQGRMRLAQRVKQLERRAGPCSLCGGRGKMGVTFVPPDAEDFVPPGCPACGQVIHVQVVYVDVLPPGEDLDIADPTNRGSDAFLVEN